MDNPHYIPLAAEQIKTISRLSEQLVDYTLPRAILEAIDAHRGPYEYSDAPGVLIAQHEVSEGFWGGLEPLKRMRLSSQLDTSDGRVPAAQVVEQSILNEILEFLVALVIKLFTPHIEGIIEPDTRSISASEGPSL